MRKAWQVGAEAWIACFIRIYRWAAGERLSPAKVALQHANADTPDIYRDFFACPVEFGAYEHFGRVYLQTDADFCKYTCRERSKHV